MVDNEESHRLDEYLDARPFIKHIYRSLGSQNSWVFNSRVISMSTSNKSIFECMDLCQESLTIISGLYISIKGRGIVRFNLVRDQQVSLGGVIYMLGLAENLLSLKALHLARYKLRGSLYRYKLIKNGKTVIYRKRIS